MDYMKILEANRCMIEQIIPDLESKIEKTEYQNNILLCEAQTGETIIAVQREQHIYYLNSRYNPLYAAKVYAKRYPHHAYGTYFVFGFSDGMHIRELLRNNDKTNHIIICEPCVEIFQKICETYDITDILRDQRVKLYIPQITASIESILKQTLQYSDFTYTEFCILPGYDVLYHDACEAYQDAIIERIQDETVRKSTSVNFQRLIPHNTLYNMKQMIFHHHIGQIREMFSVMNLADIPVIIVAAGPSLDKNIKELKRAEGKALIIVVDAALRAVIREGIKPDLVCTVDPNPPERFFTDMDLSDIIWCCEYAAKPSVIEQYGKQIYYFGFFERQWNETLSRMLGYPFPALPTGGSVSSIAFALACFLGFTKIVFIGQDLAFTGGKSHTSGVEGALGDNDAYIKSRFLMEVEGIDGTMYQTDFQMWYYKRWFERAIMENGELLTVIDATEGGAKIEGTRICKLSDVIDRECRQEFVFQKMAKNVPPAFTEAQQEQLLQLYYGMKQQTMELKKVVLGQIELAQKILAKLSQGEHEENSTQMLRQLLEENIALEEKPLFELMSSYAQKAEYELGDSIYAKDDMSVTEIVEESLRLFKGYSAAVNMLLEDIGENLDEKDTDYQRTVGI